MTMICAQSAYGAHMGLMAAYTTPYNGVLNAFPVFLFLFLFSLAAMVSCLNEPQEIPVYGVLCIR